MTWLHAIWCWAAGDRIRASPRDGKLLRLKPGACLRVGDTPAQVVARTVSGHDDGRPHAVEYVCRAVAGELRLRVRPAADAGVRMELVTGGTTREVGSGEVEVFG